MSTDPLKLTFRYALSDLFHAINFKFNKLLKEIRFKRKGEYWLLRIIKPILITSIVVLKGFKVLRYEYSYRFDQKFHSSTSKHSSSVNWDRFVNFTETDKVLFLNLNIEKSNDGPVMIPKRVLSDIELSVLLNILIKYEINEGEIDFNLSI